MHHHTHMRQRSQNLSTSDHPSCSSHATKLRGKLIYVMLQLGRHRGPYEDVIEARMQTTTIPEATVYAKKVGAGTASRPVMHHFHRCCQPRSLSAGTDELVRRILPAICLFSRSKQVSDKPRQRDNG